MTGGSGRDYRRLERIAMRAWPCFETIEYDGWVLRFADGYTKRANSVNPHFGSSLPLAEKVAACERVYAEHGLPTIFRLTGFSEPAGLDEALDDAGYTTFDQTLVYVGLPRRIETGRRRAVRRVGLPEWLLGFDRLKPLEPTRRAAHHRIVASSEGRPFHATIENAGIPIACGLGLLVEDAVGLFDLHVDESHRRRGYATAIVEAILDWAAVEGGKTAYLQVHRRNDAARALYRGFGFEMAYPYWYRIAPPPRV